MSTTKINVGAGEVWFKEGWDVLDNAPAVTSKPWKYKGKCWDTNLPDDKYEILFTSHTLEHVPHFRLEKTIAEFNRIMKVGGTIRILVPSLRQAAEAYVNNDVEFFSGSRHYSSHMGIGASFVRLLISPGGQTLALSREMDEILGGYAHLYSYDFEMMKTVLEKWGFGEVRECAPGHSEIEELRDHQHVLCDGRRYDMKDPFVRKKKFLEPERNGYVSGFDKTATDQLVVEAKKIRNEPYEFDKEYEFNKGSRFESKLDHLKLNIFRFVCVFVDGAYNFAKASGLIKLLRMFR